MAAFLTGRGMMPPALHIPVLLEEVLAALHPAPGETHVDGTFGAGGYARAILATGAEVVAFDRDPDAVAAGRELELHGLTIHEDRFARMADYVDAPVDGVVLDIGVSSMQLDQPDRGFSFQSDGPLDMRMEQKGESAADFLNSAEEAEIADTLYQYGEEPKSRRIARAIVAARPILRTAQLAGIVRRAAGYRPGDKKDPATRTFQAVRIRLNRELEELEDGLIAAEQILKPGGRLAVVTFHSLEDRIVKQFFRNRSGSAPSGSRHMPQTSSQAPRPSFSGVAKPVRPSEAEIARNPRARSATLRVACRTAAPALSERKAVA